MFEKIKKYITYGLIGVGLGLTLSLDVLADDENNNTDITVLQQTYEDGSSEKSVIETTYDNQGRITADSEHVFVNNSIKPNGIIKRTFLYDAEGKILQETYESDRRSTDSLVPNNNVLTPFTANQFPDNNPEYIRIVSPEKHIETYDYNSDGFTDKIYVLLNNGEYTYEDYFDTHMNEARAWLQTASSKREKFKKEKTPFDSMFPQILPWVANTHVYTALDIKISPDKEVRKLEDKIYFKGTLLSSFENELKERVNSDHITSISFIEDWKKYGIKLNLRTTNNTEPVAVYYTLCYKGRSENFEKLITNAQFIHHVIGEDFNTDGELGLSQEELNIMLSELDIHKKGYVDSYDVLHYLNK